jgi:hypothetical protein
VKNEWKNYNGSTTLAFISEYHSVPLQFSDVNVLYVQDHFNFSLIVGFIISQCKILFCSVQDLHTQNKPKVHVLITNIKETEFECILSGTNDSQKELNAHATKFGILEEDVLQSRTGIA